MGVAGFSQGGIVLVLPGEEKMLRIGGGCGRWCHVSAVDCGASGVAEKIKAHVLAGASCFITDW